MYEENKKNKLVLIIIAFGICIVSIIIYLIFFNSKLENTDKWNKLKESKYSINISEKDNLLYFKDTLSEEEKNNSFDKYTYYCLNSKCNGLYISQDIPYAIIKDGNKVTIYNYKDNLYKLLNINDTSLTAFDVLYYDNQIYGILASKNNKYGIYSFEKNNFITDFKYIQYENNNASLSDYKFVVTNSESNNYEVIDLKNGEVKLSGSNIISSGNINNIYYLLSKNSSEHVLYNKNFNIITNTNYKYLEVTSDGNAVIKTSNDTFSIYNNTNLIKSSKKYNEVILIIKDYALVVDVDNYLKLVDFNDNFISRIAEYNSTYVVNNKLSGWYNKDNNDLVYIIIEDNYVQDGEYGRAYEYYFNPKTHELSKKVLFETEAYEKPIIYLYPTKDNTKVIIKFENPRLITTTYPKYNDNWTVFANKNGDLYDLNNKYYYGLYFEEEQNNIINFSEGFYVTKENAIEFLEEKLSILGLNNKEKNEFIMYWLPILEKNGQSLVYFELTESREKYNKLNITPTYDSLLRIAIHIKKVNSKIKIKEQKLPTFNRIGFTVVEWGGVNYK